MAPLCAGKADSNIGLPLKTPQPDRGSSMRRSAIFMCLALAGAPARANDSTAELGTGGLLLSRNDVISMESEDLHISDRRVSVDYVFRNRSDADVETVVAFPMPDIEGNPYWSPAIPLYASDNFLGFEVTIDGKPVTARLEQKAFAVGIDISAELAAHDVPLYPFGDGATAALAKLPQEVADDWQNRGIIVVEEYDDGSGMKRVRSPYWQLKSTYWWRTVFPANKEVKVSHRYRPSVGATSGLTFFSEGRFQGTSYESYKQKYCIDQSFERAILKAAKDSPEGYPLLYETRLSYILTTGGNWATGTIGKFKLTVDKVEAKRFISFCGEGVKKTGPTTFELTAENYYPDRDLDILIVGPFDMPPAETSPTQGKPTAPAAGAAGSPG
jgi:hypothetical protein